MTMSVSLAAAFRRPIGLPTVVCVVAVVAVLLLGLAGERPVVALDCYQCGQYNDGVGSITPCLIYSEPLEKEHLKTCPRGSDNFCIKYVSELSVVRDCVAECKEKEVWETRTYCCNEDGCNHAAGAQSVSIVMLLALVMATVFLGVRGVSTARQRH